MLTGEGAEAAAWGAGVTRVPGQQGSHVRNPEMQAQIPPRPCPALGKGFGFSCVRWEVLEVF